MSSLHPSKEEKRTKHVTFNIKQGVNKNLREFIKRFSLVIKYVNKWSYEVEILALQEGLKANTLTRGTTASLAKS